MSTLEKLKHTTIILDPLGVLFYSPGDHVLFDYIRTTNAWKAWYCGMPGSPSATFDVFKDIAKEIGGEMTADSVRECLEQGFRNLRIYDDVLETLQMAKTKSVDIYLLKNIPGKYWKMVTEKPGLMDVMTGAFVLESDKVAKDLDNGLRAIKIDARNAVFVSPKPNHIFVAKIMGITGLLAKNSKYVARDLTNLFGKPPQTRAWDFLNTHAGRLYSEADGYVAEDGDTRIADQLSQLLIIQALGNPWKIVHLWPQTSATLFKFFDNIGLQAIGINTNGHDVNTTALSHLLLETPLRNKKEALDLIIRKFKGEDLKDLDCNEHNSIGMNIVMYANVLRLAYRFDFAPAMRHAMGLVMTVLEDYAYEIEEHNEPQMFFYFLACLVDENRHTRTFSKPSIKSLKKALVKAVEGQVGRITDPLALALIVLTRQKLGIGGSTPFIELLKRLQCVDGGWEASIYATYGPFRLPLKNRGVTTAFALKAIHEHEFLASVTPQSLVARATRRALVKLENTMSPAVHKKAVDVSERFLAYIEETPSVDVRSSNPNPFAQLSEFILNSGYVGLISVSFVVGTIATFLFNLWRTEDDSGHVEFNIYQLLAMVLAVLGCLMLYRHDNPVQDLHQSAKKVQDMAEDARMQVAEKIGGGIVAVGNAIQRKLTPMPRRTVVRELKQTWEDAVTDQQD
jgi:FMN phosphatase YigB (HAD superfamily)